MCYRVVDLRNARHLRADKLVTVPLLPQASCSWRGGPPTMEGSGLDEYHPTFRTESISVSPATRV
jgi:hypothetical protein